MAAKKPVANLYVQELDFDNELQSQGPTVDFKQFDPEQRQRNQPKNGTGDTFQNFGRWAAAREPRVGPKVEVENEQVAMLHDEEEEGNILPPLKIKGGMEKKVYLL